MNDTYPIPYIDNDPVATVRFFLDDSINAQATIRELGNLVDKSEYIRVRNDGRAVVVRLVDGSDATIPVRQDNIAETQEHLIRECAEKLGYTVTRSKRGQWVIYDGAGAQVGISSRADELLNNLYHLLPEEQRQAESAMTQDEQIFATRAAIALADAGITEPTEKDFIQAMQSVLDRDKIIGAAMVAASDKIAGDVYRKIND